MTFPIFCFRVLAPLSLSRLRLLRRLSAPFAICFFTIRLTKALISFALDAKVVSGRLLCYASG